MHSPAVDFLSVSCKKLDENSGACRAVSDEAPVSLSEFRTRECAHEKSTVRMCESCDVGSSGRGEFSESCVVCGDCEFCEGNVSASKKGYSGSDVFVKICEVLACVYDVTVGDDDVDGAGIYCVVDCVW